MANDGQLYAMELQGNEHCIIPSRSDGIPSKQTWLGVGGWGVCVLGGRGGAWGGGGRGN